MIQLTLEKPLTNMQMEMLKLFSADLSETDLKELSDILSKYLMKKSREKATEIWDKKDYNEETINKWLNKEYD